LLTDLAIRCDIVRITYVELIDLRLRHELFDIDGALGLDSDGLELLWLHLNILAFGDFISLNDLIWRDLLACLRIDFAIADAIAGLFVEPIEADLFALGNRGIEGYGTGDEQQLR
jgi:hypothetical protein